MTTCKDCIHYELCEDAYISECAELLDTDVDAIDRTKINMSECDNCEHFKDRSKFIDLPCKVGNTVHYLKTLMDGKGTIVIKKDIVKQISINSHGVFLVISYCYCLNAAEFGKTIFLTPEEAKKALEEREQE